MAIIFTVPAIPVAQPRQRTTAFQGKDGRVHAHNYTPSRHPVNAFKAAVQAAARAEYNGPPLDGPLYLEAIFLFPRPKRLIWKKRPMPRQRHWSKPDRDNCEKAVMDALSGILWRDDGQVCDGPIIKWYAGGYEQPHVEISVWKLLEVAPVLVD